MYNIILKSRFKKCINNYFYMYYDKKTLINEDLKFKLKNNGY